MKIIADENIPFVAECFSSVGNVTLAPGREITPSLVADADILLVRSVTRVDANLLDKSKVRFVGTATIGFDHVDIDYLEKQGIAFTSAPGSNANSVAEYIICALLELANKNNLTLQGKSIGIIGVGNVGNRVEQKAEALGMKIFLNDPPLQKHTGDKKYLPIEKLFDCDFITLHTPLTFEGQDKTHHLADEKFFKALKDGCVFFNTSRGAVTKTIALKPAIKSGKLQGVVLDVWEDEPNIDTELLEMVDIATAHIAGYSLDGKIVGMIMLYKAACEYFDCEPKFGIASFLPGPSIGEMKLNPHSDSDEKILLEAISQIYNIKQDDARLRWILDKPAGKRGKYFTQLRKEYSVRREFQNTKIILKNKDDNLMGKLTGIGFRVDA